MPTPTEQGPRWKLKAGVIVVAVVVLLIVMLQNREPVETRLLFARMTMPLALLLLLTMVVGFALGAASVILARHRSRSK
ncbi:MAG: DUF1049 domain-containing protein [Phycisphaerales bacterium]|nr:DUF1049 domain-containing protein [Phycisphaerales bacterium]